MHIGAGGGTGYWDAEIAEASEGPSDDLWYEYMDGVYRDLVESAGPRQGPSLKTDLYEEARGAHAPFRHLPEPRIGIDISQEVVGAAMANMERCSVACTLMVADARKLPFETGSFGFVLSGSTLDHFDNRADLLAGVRELGRVLAPGGKLVLTLDNPHNPVLWLRQMAGGLARLRLRPYFVGETLTAGEGEAALREADLEVRRTRAVAHAPRDPVMRLARSYEGDLTRSERLSRRLSSFDRLENAPTRWRTGYYLAFDAVKPATASRGAVDGRAEG